MVFVLIALAGMYVARKVGWALSKAALYTSPTGVTALLCIFWGAAVAVGVRTLIQWQHPNVALKVIFGFGLGAYIAVPNYGLIAEATIPEHAVGRHELISNLPLWTFIVTSVALGFFW